MAFNKLEINELKRTWLINSLNEIYSLEGHRQNKVAEEIGGYPPSALSQAKSGAMPVPDDLIDKLVERYKLIKPKFSKEAYSTKKNELGLVKEEAAQYKSENIKLTQYLSEVNDLLKDSLADLRKNIDDLRRETTGVYDHVETLKTLLENKA